MWLPKVNTLFSALSLITSLLATVRSQSITQCTVTIESELKEQSLNYGDLQLQVVQPNTGKIIDTFPCTPDGNCFAIVQDLEQFSLRVNGPSHALFEPKKFMIGTSSSCEDSLTFTLKGNRCDIPVKVMGGDDKLQNGPAGIQIRLKHTIPGGYDHTMKTNE